MNAIKRFIIRLQSFVRRPLHELRRGPRGVRWVAFLFDLARQCQRALQYDRASEMAAALTYRTIFGLVPTAVVAVLVFRAFGGFEQIGEHALDAQVQNRLFSYFGLSVLIVDDASPTDLVDLPELNPDDDPVAVEIPDQPAGEEDTAITKQEIRTEINRIIGRIKDQTQTINFGSLGLVGVILLIYSALLLVVTIEETFNVVYSTPRGRSWVQRIITYWALITLGPILLVFSIYITDEFIHWGQSIPVFGTLLTWLGGVFALIASWLLLYISYTLMPNTRVDRRSALIGSFVAAVLWEAGKWGFKLFVKRAVSYSVIYGSLGLIPLFFYWIFITWYIVIFGLELSYTLQAMKGRRFKYDPNLSEKEMIADPHWLLLLMTRIGQAFSDGHTISRQELAEELQISSRLANELLDHLEEAGLIRSVLDEDQKEAVHTSLILARPPTRIKLVSILDVAKSISLRHKPQTDEPDPGWTCLEQLIDSQRRSLADQTLADLLDGNDVVPREIVRIAQ